MFYVYLLQSVKDQSYYIGQTEDTSKRLNRHNAGLVPSTRLRKPWSLLGFEIYNTRKEARWREYRLKRNQAEKKKFIDKIKSHIKTALGPEAEGKGRAPAPTPMIRPRSSVD